MLTSLYFQDACARDARDARDSTLLGGYDSLLDLSFTPHQISRNYYRKTLTPEFPPIPLSSVTDYSSPPTIVHHTSPHFEPVPNHSHIFYTTSAYPLDTREEGLTGFPATAAWMDDEDTAELVERLESLREDVKLDSLEEEGDVLFDNDAVGDWDIGGMFGVLELGGKRYLTFFLLSIALRRDFSALKSFLELANIDQERFLHEARVQDVNDPEEVGDDEVVAILDIYEKRVGRSPFEVKRL